MSVLLYSLVVVVLVVTSCEAWPNGPPVEACGDMRPMHPNTEPQTSSAPIQLFLNNTAGEIVRPEQYIQVSLQMDAGRAFKGFMIQARPSSTATPIGTFVIPATTQGKTLQCSNPDDTATHNNNNTKAFVTVVWVAPLDLSQDFRFYYTVVERYDTYWVMESSDMLPGVEDTPEGKTVYIQAHGSLMAVAWGLLIPVGIILALFYKVVWPNGHWFYIHVVVMVTAVLVVVAGVVLIVVHSEGKWLDSTDLNLSHQVLGVIALVAVVINPLLGLFLIFECCSLGTKWRAAYNCIHGGIGLLFAQGVALAAMLVGVHILRDHPRNFDSDTVHNAIYSVSAVVATVIMIIALYNGYSIRFHKEYPKPGTDTDDDELEPSKDWIIRLIAGVVIICLLLAPVISTIYFLANLS